MDAVVEKLRMPVTEDTCQYLYKVDYEWVIGDGYSSSTLWRTFGVYENELIANFICNQIVDGYINPVTKS